MSHIGDPRYEQIVAQLPRMSQWRALQAILTETAGTMLPTDLREARDRVLRIAALASRGTPDAGQMACVVCLTNEDEDDVRPAGTVLRGFAVCLVPDGDGGFGPHFELAWSLADGLGFREATLALADRDRT